MGSKNAVLQLDGRRYLTPPIVTFCGGVGLFGVGDVVGHP